MDKSPRAVMFDLDETLAESFTPAAPTMLERLTRLSRALPFAVISGAGFDRIERDLMLHMPAARRENIALFPNSSSQCFLWHDGWRAAYDIELSEDERVEIRRAIERAILEVPEAREAPHWGERVVDRGAQIAFAIIGTEAPHDAKRSWDPLGEKRAAIAKHLSLELPGYDVYTGGSSTVDITRAGINKAYGVRWYAEHLGAKPADLLYIGDALYPGGNDYVVIPTGIATRRTESPLQTEQFIDEILSVPA